MLLLVYLSQTLLDEKILWANAVFVFVCVFVQTKNCTALR